MALERNPSVGAVRTADDDHGAQYARRIEPGWRVGIDVGGTFTDLFAFDEASGAVHTHKVSSTPGDPHRAPIDGLRQLLDRIGAHGDQVVFLGLGTTVATNAFLEGKGARVGLITTRGFRDLLEIGRQTRPHLYDPFVRKPVPLVPRNLRCEVSERIAADGTVVEKLDEEELQHAIHYLKDQDVRSVAICFLNSYANPCHEAQALALVRRSWSHIDVVSSYEVIPEFREYERLVSTVVNAYLIPAMRDYFDEFARAVADLSIKVAPLIVSSSGGVFTPAMAGARPIDTLFSGPSAGVSGAVFVSQCAGIGNIVTFDMGGTSTEVCLVREGKPQISHRRELKGYPIRTTSHDIHTIGAGGSSIAVVDSGGMLQVGPQSAGADPGPACYDAHGEFATVTDANVVLGRLNQDYLLGGALRISSSRSTVAVECQVAGPKELDLRQAASSVVALAEANMAQAIRVVSVERGIDPKDYTLVAFGGAGPLHACSVARQVGMADVLVPLHPGVLCAMGVLTKDVQANFSRTKIVDAVPDCCATIESGYAELERTALARLTGQRIELSRLRFERSAAVRYKGQNHEIDIAMPQGAFDAGALSMSAQSFHRAHEELYGYCFEGNAIELVTLRLAGVVPVARPRSEPQSGATEAPLLRPLTQRMVTFEEAATAPWPVYERSALQPGQSIDGPAIVEQMDTTVVIPPGFRSVVDPWLNLRITWS